MIYIIIEVFDAYKGAYSIVYLLLSSYMYLRRRHSTSVGIFSIIYQNRGM